MYKSTDEETVYLIRKIRYYNKPITVKVKNTVSDKILVANIYHGCEKLFGVRFEKEKFNLNSVTSILTRLTRLTMEKRIE